MEIQNDQKEVFIKDFATIDSASQIHEIFYRAFESKRSVVLDVSQTTEFDLTFVQLICSFCSSMTKEGLVLQLNKNNLPEYFQNDLKLLGFQDKIKCIRNSSVNCIMSIENSYTESNQESAL